MTLDDGIDIDEALLDSLAAGFRRAPDSPVGISNDEGKKAWTRAEASAIGEAYRKALAQRGFELTLHVYPIDAKAPDAGFGAGLYPPSRAERLRQQRREEAEEVRATEQALREVRQELVDAQRARDEYRAARDAAMVRLDALEDAMRHAVASLPPDHALHRLLDDALNPRQDSV